MFGDRIKAFRKMHNMSQEELANKIHVTRQTLSKWENNLSAPNADVLFSISKSLGVPLGDLLGDSVPEMEEQTHRNDKLEEIAEQLVSRNQHNRKIWILIGVAFIILILLFIVIVIRNYLPDISVSR